MEMLNERQIHKKSHEHSARLKNPGKFVSFTTGEDKGGKGVNFIYGIRKDAGVEGGKTEIQAIRFDSKLWSVDDAKKWLSDHNKKYIKFTAATIREDGEPAITTSNMGATYAPKVLPMTSHYGDYPTDRYDQSFMRKMKKSLGESVVVEGKKTRLGYEEYLNEIGIPDDDLESNGGRIPDGSNYGTWMRKNDPIAFNVGYREWVLSESMTEGKKKKFDIYFNGEYLSSSMTDKTAKQVKDDLITSIRSGKYKHPTYADPGTRKKFENIAKAIVEPDEFKVVLAEAEPSINPDGTSDIPPSTPSADLDAPGKDLMVPRDTDPILFDDYVRVYNSVKPEDRDTDEKLTELAALIIKKYFGEKKVQWGSDGVEIMDDQLIFKNFSSSEDVSPEGEEVPSEGAYHAAMTSVSEGRGEFKEGDIVAGNGGQKFRIYNISPNWAALKDVDTDEKTMVPIGDLYEFYRKAR